MIFFFNSILLLFSRYSLPYVQFVPLFPKLSQVSAAFSFSNEVRWRQTWVEQCWPIQNCFWVWLSVTSVTADFKWSWNLIEGMLISDTLYNIHETLKKKNFVGKSKNCNMHLSLLKSFHLQQGYDWTKTPLIKGTRPVGARSWWQASTFLLRNPLPSSWHWLLPNNGGNFSASEEESSTCPPGMCMGHAASLPVLFHEGAVSWL